MLFATEHPFVPISVSDQDKTIASMAFGWTLGFGYFTVCHAVRETKRTNRINTYVILIWGEIIACLVFAIMCWLYLHKQIQPSFGFFFSILVSWVFQVQLLLQIIVNRLCILLPGETRRNQLRWGIAAIILAINISVFCIWLPAKLQINDTFRSINVWWDRTEKCLYLLVDAALNWYFIVTVKERLVKHGFKKYDKLVRFNTQIVFVSLAMDVLIVGAMSLKNDFVYMQFHPVAYMVKLNIEMSMGNLLIKVASSTGVTVYEGGVKSSEGGTSKETATGGVEVHVNRQVFSTHHLDERSSNIEMENQIWPHSGGKTPGAQSMRSEDMDDLKIKESV